MQISASRGRKTASRLEQNKPPLLILLAAFYSARDGCLFCSPLFQDRSNNPALDRVPANAEFQLIEQVLRRCLLVLGPCLVVIEHAAEGPFSALDIFFRQHRFIAAT